MRIRPSVVLAASASALLATACTGGGAPSSGGSGGGTEDATLRFLVEEPEDAAATQRLEEHLADFTAESGIEVELETLPWETMNTTLQTQLRSGEGPDVFSWGSGPSFGGALAENGLLYDLTEAYEENDWEIYDFAVERVSSDGKIWGIPGEMETVGLFYNAEILEQVGVEPPQSLDDLREVAAAVKEAGYVPLAAADQEGWEGGHYLSMALSSAIGSERMEALMNGEESWESPEVVDALRFWQEANDNGWLVESPTAVNYDTATAQFFSGEA
ncbi:MAG: ABC transporter substrate-binding protein, partial [Actinomycetes bacterium]